MLIISNLVFAADNLGYSPNLNDEDTNNAVILPFSNNTAANSRPQILLLPNSLDANYIIVPMPESLTTEEASNGHIKTKPMQPIIK
jgi:hypothetical protein